MGKKADQVANERLGITEEEIQAAQYLELKEKYQEDVKHSITGAIVFPISFFVLSLMAGMPVDFSLILFMLPVMIWAGGGIGYVWKRINFPVWLFFGLGFLIKFFICYFVGILAMPIGLIVTFLKLKKYEQKLEREE